MTRQINQWCKDAKNKGSEWADEKHTEVVNQVRYQNLARYMDVCGVDTPDRIDWDNPHVKIMEILSDPINLSRLWSKNDRQKVYDLMDEET